MAKKKIKVEAPAGFGLTPEQLAFVMGVADAKAASHQSAVTKGRRGIAGAILASVEAGKVPARMVFPKSNAHAQKHADRLFDLANENSLGELMDYHIGGSNTYAALLRTYRDACIELLKGQWEAVEDASRDAADACDLEVAA